MVENGSDKEFLPGYPTIDQFTQTNLKRILSLTKVSNDLPGNKREDYDFYSTFPEFRKSMATQGKKLREMIKTQLSFQGMKTGVPQSNIDSLVDMLTDANDSILERINISLDEAGGGKKIADPLLLSVSQSNVSRVAGSWNNFDRTKFKGENKAGEVKLLAAKNVLRPQVKFKKFIDNTSAPFTPRLTEKPHSKKPLSILVEYDDSNTEFFSHPYLFEMERLKPEGDMVTLIEASMPKSVDTTDFAFIQTSNELNVMIEELKQHSVIGVDLEAHNYRTYQGITCLVQISSAEKDYLVDPFPIWEEMTQLNVIFADPRIVKVLHGCREDVQWLQRDFSVYLVNIFDTHIAGKLLNLPRLSLAWLLENYCKIYADKQYQLADWRIRPLPEVMVYYARQDTRYLIYLYQKLKVELLSRGNEQKNLLLSSYQQSNMITMNRYNKPMVTPDSYKNILKKSKAVHNNRQLYAMQELYSWRDSKGRQEDESTNYVLPNHMMLKISTELPREMQGILACCNPIPPLVKQNLQELHEIMRKARSKTLLTVDKDLMAPTQEHAETEADQMDFNDNPLKCPLDFTRMDIGSGLSTLINIKSGDTQINKLNPKSASSLVKSNADLAVFSSNTRKTKQAPKIKPFISPYERYSLLVPYLEKLKAGEEISESKDGESPESVQGEKKEPETKDDLHLESIMKHFQKLTDMTPKPKKDVEVEEESEEDVETIKDEYINEPVKPIHRGGIGKSDAPTGPNNDKKKKLIAKVDIEVEKRKLAIENKLVQEEINQKKRKNKRKSVQNSQEDTPSKVPKEELNYEKDVKEVGGDKGNKEPQKKDSDFDYSNVDFSDMFKMEQPDGSKDFNPNKGMFDKKKKRGGGRGGGRR